MKGSGGSNEVELLGVERDVRRTAVPTMAIVAVLLVGLAVLLLRPGAPISESSVAEIAPPGSTTSNPPEQGGFSQLTAGPVLGEETGLMLVVGSVDSDLRALNLDTGTVQWSATALYPRFVDGGRLVAVNNWGRWSRLPITDLASADTDGFDPVADFRPVVHLVDESASDGHAWARTPGREGRQVWRLVELASGRVIDVADVPADAYVPESDSGPLVGPSIVGSLGAGIFERTDDDEFVERHPGRLVAVGEGLLLVSTCDSSFTCQLSWLDRSNFGPVDLPPPDVEPGDGFLVGGDSVLVVEDRSTLIPVTRIVDVATGRTIRSAGETSLHDVWISPDGRWLARPSGGELQIRDLQSDSVHSIGGLRLQRGDELIWARTDQTLTRPTAVAEPSWAPLETPDVPASHPSHGTD